MRKVLKRNVTRIVTDNNNTSYGVLQQSDASHVRVLEIRVSEINCYVGNLQMLTVAEFQSKFNVPAK